MLIMGGAVFADEVCELALLNGRVIDPESDTDIVRNIGIKAGKIFYLGTEAVETKKTIDIAGLVVSPGFIDFLSYDQNGTGEYYKAADGVTTNLSMHGASMVNFEKYFENTKNKLYLNQGGAISQIRLRYSVGLMDAYQKPSTVQIQSMCELAEKAYANGALGLNLSTEYLPGTTFEEELELAKVTKKWNALMTGHIRYSTMFDKKTNIDAIREVIELVRQTGVSFQIDHINSTGGTFSMAASLDLIKKANEEGLDITLDMYPYDSWATYLASARFDGDWQKRFQITYKDLQIANQPERLTEEKFKTIKKMKAPYNNPLTVAYAVPEKDIVTALLFPGMIIGSDTIIEPDKNNHPRGAGCYARLFQKYVKETKLLTLTQAIAMCSYYPARRLEGVSSAMKNKGRIKEGADADLVIFDPEKIKEKATVESPGEYSEGIEMVLVNGRIVKDNAGIVKGIFPGKPVKRDSSYFTLKKSPATLPAEVKKVKRIEITPVDKGLLSGEKQITSEKTAPLPASPITGEK